MPWLHAFVDVPAGQQDSVARFWGDALGWPPGEPWARHPEFRSFEPQEGRAYVHLQQIDGPARVHLDVESHDVGDTATRAAALGAQPVAQPVAQPDVQPVVQPVAAHESWQTLRSPGGLPFCVVPEGEHRPPGPVTWPDGHRTRMLQVCIDSPAAVHHAEVDFWRSLLGGRWAESDAPEFAGRWHDDAGSPVQLLFQRLDEPEGQVRAHLDLGTDDLDAEVRRLLRLGASDLGRGRGGWHVLRDPAGSAFCATLNSPDQSLTRDIG